MKAKRISLIIGMMLVPSLAAFSADSTFDGNITLLGEYADIEGNKAKYNEYRDIDRYGLYSGLDLNYDSKDTFLKAKASDMAYDTQHYRVDAGRYGKFKFFLDYNEVPHNFTYDAKTFYSDPGSNNLTFPALPTADTSTWKTFDYAIKRKTGATGFTFDNLKPFYITASASREERSGIRPMGVAATGAGGIALELPEPIDYATHTVKFEAGYGKKPVFAAINFLYSNFNNANSVLFFSNPATSTSDEINLPPDNQYYKLGLKGSVRLPLNSRFNVNLASSRTTSASNLFSSYVTAVGGVPTIVPISVSDTLFNGKIDTHNYNVVLTSNPLPFFTSKIFYKYYSRDNKSDEITTIDPNLEGGTPLTNKLFEYRKNSYGIEFGFRMPASFFLQTAYSYLQTNRARGDYPETRDNIYSAELKWNEFDLIIPKIGYEHLKRGADHGVLIKAEGQDVENAIEPFIGRFDAAHQERNTFTAAIEFYPLETLDIELGYRYKAADYTSTILGLRNARINEIYLDAGYRIGQIARINAYSSYERNRSTQFQRRFQDVSQADPNNTGGDTAGGLTPSYNWNVNMKDDSLSYGVNAELFIVPQKLTIMLLYDNIKSNGHADFTYFVAPLEGGRTNDNIDIGAWDDYRLRSLAAKIRYTPTKTYEFNAGYVYERFTYNDASWDNYAYTSGPLPPAATNSNSALLTGAYANPSYHANVVFLGATYRF